MGSWGEMKHVLVILAWAVVAGPACMAAASTDGALNGTWEFEYSCAGATGVYADRCAAGDRDDFTLSIAQSGNRFCGGYEATAQLGNHVDDGDLKDWTFTPTSDQTFHVHFHLSGTVGEAEIRLSGDKLHWSTLTEQQNAESGS